MDIVIILLSFYDYLQIWFNMYVYVAMNLELFSICDAMIL